MTCHSGNRGDKRETRKELGKLLSYVFHLQQKADGDKELIGKWESNVDTTARKNKQQNATHEAIFSASPRLRNTSPPFFMPERTQFHM